jgi:hypothetical protein
MGSEKSGGIENEGRVTIDLEQMFTDFVDF